MVIEDHHGVVALAAFVHRIVDIDMPLGILANTVSVAVFDVGRKFTPIVVHFVRVVARADHRQFAAGFILCAQNRWGQGIAFCRRS